MILSDSTFSSAEPSEPAVEILAHAIAQAPFAALLFRADEKLTLLWRNSAHETMSGSVGLEVAGQGMFEAFPPTQDEEGKAAMTAILDTVAEMRETKTSKEIGPYRYDLQTDGRFVEYHWRISMSPVVSDGELVAVLQVAQDVTREVLDKRLSETLRRSATSTADVSHFSYDPGTDDFVRSGAVDTMFGFAPGEAGDLAAPFFERVHADDLPGVREEVARVLAAPPGEVAAFDYRVLHPDTSERFLRVRAEVAIDPSDRRAKLVGTFVDLTDVENDRRQLKRELALREALVEEANHRIKNSLSIALAMLRMGKQSILRADANNTEAAITEVEAMETRIGAITKAHGAMRLNGDRTDVVLGDLLEGLVRQMQVTADLSEEDIRLVLRGSEVRIDSDLATSLSLIMNELLTNAVKYGLNSAGSADIELVAETGSEGCSITITNRIETEDPIDAIPSTRLGSTLVRQLASDFGTEVETDASDGVYASRIRLPASIIRVIG